MIGDYTELIVEVAARSGIPDVASRARMWVGMAEKMLSKRLRLAEMEQSQWLKTDEAGQVALPTDFQEMRALSVSGQPLSPQSLEAIRTQKRSGYCVQGRLLVSSFAETDHQLDYYSAVPNLEQTHTNWLLDDHPELYLHGTLMQAYLAQNDLEKAQATGQYLNELVRLANESEYLKRHAGTRINLGFAP